MQKLISFHWAIKRILSSKANFEILEGFLSELIAPDKDIKILQVLDPASNKEAERDTFNRVDLLVAIDAGEMALIEVQVNRPLEFLQRIINGDSKIITKYIEEQAAYSTIKKVYAVNVLYFDLDQGEDYVYKGTSVFMGIHSQKPLQLTTSRQKKLYAKDPIKGIYPEYYIINVNNFDNIIKNRLDEWIYFFKNGEIKSEFQAKGLLKAKQALDILKLSKEERALYSRYQDDLHYQASMVDSSYGEGKAAGLKQGKRERLQEEIEKRKQAGLQEGLEKGKEEGKRAAKISLAQAMLSKGYSLNEIIQLTDLSQEEIEGLKK